MNSTGNRPQYCVCSVCEEQRRRGTFCECEACSAARAYEHANNMPVQGCYCNFCLRARASEAQRLAQYQPPLEQYWVVMNTDVRQMRASFRHTSLEAAKTECERLAKKEGGTFAVFAMVACISPIVVHSWRDIEPPLPF